MVPIVLRLQNALKVRGIHARFQAAQETKASYVTTTVNGKGQVSTNVQTAVEQVSIAEQNQLLAGRVRAGFFANMCDAIATMFGGGRHQVMSPGEHEYFVQVSVPAVAPPTHSGDLSRVFYELTCVLDIPFGRDLREVYSFRMAPERIEQSTHTVQVRYPDDEGRGFWDRLWGPDVRIDLVLAKDVFSLDDTIEGIFQIETVERIEVRSIRARLVGRESSEAHGHKDSHVYEGGVVEIGTPVSIQGSHSQRFSLTADSVREMPVTAKGDRFSIEWFVQIELDVPWAKDPRIRAPIVLTQ